MRLMDTWIHCDRLMKIERATSNDASSSRAMWRNLDASSWIERTRLKDVNSQNDIQFEPLIKDESTHPTVTPKINYKFNCSATQKFVLGFSSKSNCLETTI